MSFMTALPGNMDAATAALSDIGASVVAANIGAVPIHAVVPMAPEPASAVLALMFQQHAVLSSVTQGVGIAQHELFTSTLAATTEAYSAVEAASVPMML